MAEWNLSEVSMEAAKAFLSNHLTSYSGIARLLALYVAVLHVLFFFIELFPFSLFKMWSKRGKVTKDKMNREGIQMANQACYNLALAVFLFWADATGNVALGKLLLAAIAVLGFIGAFSADFIIFFAQCFPALSALAMYEYEKSVDQIFIVGGLVFNTCVVSFLAILCGIVVKSASKAMLEKVKTK